MNADTKNAIGGKCGCPDYRGDKVPTTRSGWKGRMNQSRRGFGAKKT